MIADLQSLAEVHWDAVVIGAGPAGCMAATLLAREGVRTLIVERRPFPRQKVCGGCVNLEAASLIHGAYGEGFMASTGARPLRTLLIGYDTEAASLPLAPTWSVTRARLDAALLDAARRAGATVATGTTATVHGTDSTSRKVVLRSDSDQVVLRASIVVCAAGLRARGAVREETRSRIWKRSRIGIGAVVAGAGGAIEDSALHMHISRDGYVGCAAAENGFTSIAAAVDPQLVRDSGSPAAAIQALLPEEQRAIVAGRTDIAWTGVPLLTQRRDAAGERLFLVGDAARYVEPITGEGIAWALRSANHLAPIALDAIRSWTPAHAKRWRVAHSRLLRLDAMRCRAVASLLRRPAAARRVIRFCDRRGAPARWLVEKPFGRLLATGGGATT